MKVCDLSNEIKAEILYRYKNTLDSLVSIRRDYKIPQYQFNAFKVFLISAYGEDFYNKRYKKQLSITKLADANPMKNKNGKLHHNYKGLVSDGRGYLMILKPDWYTGRKNSKHVFYHHVIICEALGITEIPDGFVVHHIDFDKTNNDITNLALMTKEAHAKLHAMLQKCRDYSEKK